MGMLLRSMRRSLLSPPTPAAPTTDQRWGHPNLTLNTCRGAWEAALWAEEARSGPSLRLFLSLPRQRHPIRPTARTAAPAESCLSV
eukprot:scaffold188013_cov35-Tisochrysis_lutea.AAC.4